VRSLYECFIENDCTLLEINPLAFAEDGRLLALDSKMVIDDNALFRRPAMLALRDVGQEEPVEVEAQDAGVIYVKMDGNIGCVVNGAGLAMATMDLIQLHGGEPANFLDFGGGPSVEKVRASLRLILQDPKVKAILVNIFGGITRCDVVAQALLEALTDDDIGVPIVARLVGTNAADARQMLARTQVQLATNISEAAELVVSLAAGNGGKQ
jgi:succinyl-CoA synthetase beta subunit